MKHAHKISTVNLRHSGHLGTKSNYSGSTEFYCSGNRIFNLKFAHRLADDDNYDDKRASLHVSLRTRKLEKEIQYCCRDSFFVEKYGGPHLPRQNILFHGKTYFLTAKHTFPRHNLLSHGKTYFSTAKLTFPRQNILSHGKTYFSTAKLTFPRQNILFHGKTYFSIPSFQSVSDIEISSLLNRNP